MTELERCNAWLKKEYGTDTLGRPNWRIVFSTKQTEKRKGLFSDWYGPIFLREFYGIQEVPKYAEPSWRDRWMLERLTFDLNNPELCLDILGSYEPIWCFNGPGGTYQKPVLKAVKFLMGMWVQSVFASTHEKFSNHSFAQMEAKEFQDEVDYNYHALESELGGDVASALRSGEAVAPGVIYGPDGTVSSIYAKKGNAACPVPSSL